MKFFDLLSAGLKVWGYSCQASAWSLAWAWDLAWMAGCHWTWSLQVTTGFCLGYFVPGQGQHRGSVPLALSWLMKLNQDRGDKHFPYIPLLDPCSHKMPCWDNLGLVLIRSVSLPLGARFLGLLCRRASQVPRMLGQQRSFSSLAVPGHSLSYSRVVRRPIPVQACPDFSASLAWDCWCQGFLSLWATDPP